jgi:hypothetical protein
MKRDAQRDVFLASKGYHVLRFSNLDVITNRQGVPETISTVIMNSPPHPSPASGGGSRPCLWLGPGQSRTEP